MRNLTLVFATDERGGMIFNKRRVSRDRILIKDLMDSFTGNIYITEYSRILFEEYESRVVICKDPLSSSPDGGICFVECPPIKPYIQDVSKIIAYNWNRRYPYDMCIDISPKECGFSLTSTEEFIGSSHEKITKEIFER